MVKNFKALFHRFLFPKCFQTFIIFAGLTNIALNAVHSPLIANDWSAKGMSRFTQDLGPNSLVEVFEPKDHSEVSGNILFLHGFPSLSSRNEDLIEEIVKNQKKRVYLLHYRGVWQYSRTKAFLPSQEEGSFDFTQSIRESGLVLESLIQRHGLMILMGHSWGTYVALNLLNQGFSPQLNGVILIAPYSRKLGEAASDELMDVSVKNQFPHLTVPANLGEFDQTVKRLRASWEQVHQSSHHPHDFLQKSAARAGGIAQGLKILVIAAENDKVIPLKSASLLVEQLKSQGAREVEFVHWPEGHWFNDHATGRAILIQKCSRWLSHLGGPTP